MERFFCSEASRANCEEIFGTVAQMRRWLLLEYPSAWRKRAIEDSLLFSDELKGHLCDGYDRTLLIRQEHVRTGPLRCFRIDSLSGRTEVALLDSPEELLGTPEFQECSDEPQYLVCTHGKHDPCCSKWGLPVFCALRDATGAQAWQCSHVGGDRFAANVVVFPYGLYYGHVEPSEVDELIKRSQAGEVWLPRYRGRSCRRRPEQVAEYFLRQSTGKMRIDEFEPAGVRRASGRTEVRFRAKSDGSEHVIEFERRDDTLSQVLTCHSVEVCEVPQYRLTRYTAPVDQ